MPAIARYPAANTLAGFLDSADSVYGTGMDGNAVLFSTAGSSTYSGAGSDLGTNTTPTSVTDTFNSTSFSVTKYTMQRDYYFNNLTLNSSVRIDTNGYRLFVKNILTLNAVSYIGFNTGFSGTGSVYGGGAANTSVTHSLGGSATATYTATAPTAVTGGSNYYKQAKQAVNGYSITASGGGPTWLRGGAGSTNQAGGGVVIVAARYIVTGDPTGFVTYPSQPPAFRAPGTSPAGGGVVLIITSTASLTSPITTDVTGANAGTVNIIQVI
jgi:hypothetical protein